MHSCGMVAVWLRGNGNGHDTVRGTEMGDCLLVYRLHL